MPMNVNESEGKGKRDKKKKEGESGRRGKWFYTLGRSRIRPWPTLNSIHTTQGEGIMGNKGPPKCSCVCCVPWT